MAVQLVDARANPAAPPAIRRISGLLHFLTDLNLKFSNNVANSTLANSFGQILRDCLHITSAKLNN